MEIKEWEERHKLMIEYEQIIKNEEIKWRQKARYQWFKDLDGNIKFFHIMANVRQNKNQINKISIDGRCVEDQDEIKHAFIQYFTSLYASPPNSFRCVEGLEWDCLSH